MTVLPIEHIVSTPGTSGGQPRIAGSRIRVQDVAVYNNAGWTPITIADELDLTLSQVYAALSYYLDHRDVIDQAIQNANTLAFQTPSLKSLMEELKVRKTGK